jgi:hypothetical protein
MAVKFSHVKKRMAIISGKNQKKNEILVSRNTKDGLSVSIKMPDYKSSWAVFNTEDILMALAYVTRTDEQIQEELGNVPA